MLRAVSTRQLPRKPQQCPRCRDVVGGQLPWMGYCKGADANAIQACVWTPGNSNSSGGGGKKGKKQQQPQQQRFNIIF